MLGQARVLSAAEVGSQEHSKRTCMTGLAVVAVVVVVV